MSAALVRNKLYIIVTVGFLRYVRHGVSTAAVSLPEFRRKLKTHLFR